MRLTPEQQDEIANQRSETRPTRNIPPTRLSPAIRGFPPVREGFRAAVHRATHNPGRCQPDQSTRPRQRGGGEDCGRPGEVPYDHRRLPTMAINGLRNKRCGPGGGTRRLHQPRRLPSAVLGGETGSTRVVKARTVARYDTAVIGS